MRLTNLVHCVAFLPLIASISGTAQESDDQIFQDDGTQIWVDQREMIFDQDDVFHDHGSSGNDMDFHPSCDESAMKKIARLQCFRGEKGEIGERGSVGPKGEKGNSITGPVGPSGLKGRKGDQGQCTCDKDVRGQKGIKGEPGFVSGCDRCHGMSGKRTGAIVYNNKGELLKIEKFVKPGGIAYVKSEKKFYGRVKEGWAPFLMGDVTTRKKRDERLNHWQRHNPNIPRHRRRPPLDTTSKRTSSAQNWRNTSLRLIALNDPWTGNMNGIESINYQCQKEAYDGKVSGIFRAFLSSPHSNGMDLSGLVKNRHDFIVNSKNETLFPTWKSIFKRGKMWKENDQRPANEMTYIYSFNGSNVVLNDKWDDNMIWHGTFESGTGSFTASCKSWTTADPNQDGLASDFLYKFILDQEKVSCDTSLIVLCIEVPLYLIDKHVREVVGLPKDSTKTVYLSEEEHKEALERFDDEWAHITHPQYAQYF